jgi:hypothetical protein
MFQAFVYKWGTLNFNLARRRTFSHNQFDHDRRRGNNQYQLEWKTIKIKLLEPVKKTKSNGWVLFSRIQTQPDEQYISKFFECFHY